MYKENQSNSKLIIWSVITILKLYVVDTILTATSTEPKKIKVLEK
jgi:hypothetical protein